MRKDTEERKKVGREWEGKILIVAITWQKVAYRVLITPFLEPCFSVLGQLIGSLQSPGHHHHQLQQVPQTQKKRRRREETLSYLQLQSHK